MMLALLFLLQTAPTLGLETRVPTKDEIARFELPTDLAGRCRGRAVASVEKDGPSAGLLAGDVVLQLDENCLYSADDLADFVAVTKPGAKVTALVKRAATLKEEKVELTMGSRKLSADEAKRARFAWEFAGPAQLDAALARAKKEGKLVLVGLSGAET